MRTRVRLRVHEFVSKHPGASAGKIAVGLGMAAPAVRHHLAILVSDGRLELAPVRIKRGRGRPELRYQVPGRLLGHNLAMVSDCLLRAWDDTSGARGGREIADVLARGLIQQLGPIENQKKASNRVASLVARLNALDYGARWEAGAEGPRLVFGHCPYAAVIEAHPELCEMDARAVSAVMHTTARQTGKIDLGRPGSQCVFSLRQPE